MQLTNPLHIIGIAVRTTNENNQAATDIGALWQRFLSENLAAAIPNKSSNDIYSVYTDYEKDFAAPYTTILGCAVTGLAQVPDGFRGITINAGQYERFVAQGNIHEGCVYKEWLKIWSLPLARAYTTDFEVYGEKASNPAQAEVDIYIAVT